MKTISKVYKITKKNMFLLIPNTASLAKESSQKNCQNELGTCTLNGSSCDTNCACGSHSNKNFKILKFSKQDDHKDLKVGDMVLLESEISHPFLLQFFLLILPILIIGSVYSLCTFIFALPEGLSILLAFGLAILEFCVSLKLNKLFFSKQNIIKIS